MARILIVDDDPHIRELVRLFLQQQGYGVEEAADGREALLLLDEKKIDLMIVDVMMPDIMIFRFSC